MKKDKKTLDLYHPKQDKTLVEKSLVELTKTIQPGFVMSAAQKKKMNAVQFFVQSYAAKYYNSQEEFHADYADRIMQLHIPRAHFLSLIAFNSRNQAHLKNNLEELTNIQVSYDNGLDGNDAHFEFRKLITRAGVRDGCVFFDIPPDTRKALVSSKVVATIDVLKVAENLSGKYAISLYQFLHGEFEQMKDNICVVQCEDHVLRNALNVPYELDKEKKLVWSYKSIGVFNAKVLKPAIKEINDSEFEFKIDAEHKKLGSGEVLWIFSLTKTNFARYAIIASEFATEIAEIIKELKGYGVKHYERVITQIETEKDLLYFQFCISEVNKVLRSRSPNAPKIQNKAGYFIKSLESNRDAFEEHYRELQDEREREKRLAREIEQANVKQQKESRFKEQKERLRRVAYEAQSTAAREALRDSFMLVAKEALMRKHWEALEELGLDDAIETSGVIRGLWVEHLDKMLEITDEKVERSIENMTIRSNYYATTNH